MPGEKLSTVQRHNISFLGRDHGLFDTEGFRPRPELCQERWRETLCRHTVMPYAIRDGILIFATSTYVDGLRAIRALRIEEQPIALAIAPRSEISTALIERYGNSLTRHATEDLRWTAPSLSAATPFPRWMHVLFLLALSVFCLFLVTYPVATLVNLWIVFIPYFMATITLRMILIVQAIRSTPPPPPPRQTTPVVSILIPVYGEASSLPALIEALMAFDYPVRALDIKILLEEDDTETIAEARLRTTGTHIDCLVVPSSAPRTKPKAMNFALPFVRGQIVGIFDAEDAPEPDQVSKAVAALEAAGDEIVCAQARLSYYNPDDNILTRCVAMEYALWFDLLLTGMSRTRLPIPLGGTSLYFQTDTLRDIGAWDPDNVTEDADLGLRLARAGKRAVIFESTTFEEATGSVPAWIRQRSRWIKGYMLTWAVHMRSPRRLVRDLGFRHALAINVLLLDGFFSFLLQPFILISGLLVVLADAAPSPALMAMPGMGAILTFLIGGQVVLLIAAFIASKRRFGLRTAIAAPLLWPYWMMGGMAAFKALMQVMTKPQFWEKTTHCVSPVARAMRSRIIAGNDT